ncbi:Spermidine synthase-like protein [Sulfurimonas denitrificans DSM 1251]|jgi:spermidine synthase|uniref:Spermidine synthase-like protein n=1 Tax=Sulfurimonas denitrificans (strain ATCC 33889 / DSM 1251) TaxID=326298 RepID=Q30NV9_SULDN|nr:spermidine synthase [Sulfurimonas denitrificans]ABB45322.1 Spermidine synthase-like protein [Sulfurimonas denitrificans DSM 1251]MDD3442121.1 spermidine synthase [Sulfurimonas denitrificans]
MKDFIYNEMMVHVPLCTSKEAKDILIISDKPESLSAEVARHKEANLKVINCSLGEISSLNDASFDVVISEMSPDEAFFSHVNRVLRKDAQFVTTHPSLDNVEANKSLMKILGKYFKIIMPYSIGGSNTALLASKEYHPTADLILQRADMIDGLKYYNCDVHVASFAMGNYIRKEYLGIIKN